MHLLPKTLPSLLFLFILHQFCFADTIRMMQYNMMYYTNSTPTDCNPVGNYLNDKDENLKIIIDYLLPDIFCVNEIGSKPEYINRVLNNVMNANGRDYYRSCPLTNYSGGSIANMLYYDSRKLEFYSHFYVTTYPRDINAYKMVYKSDPLAQGDTAFITFIIAHLKAGSSDTDKNDRTTQVERLTTKLEQMGIDNYVFSGDFNLYNASEPAYQHLLFNNNTAFRFFDPIDAYGKWQDNPQFATVHTQSTHTTSENGCYSTGGLDDRFDFILVSPTVFYGTRKVKVITETYQTVGQDGLRLNKSLLSPINNTLQMEILTAMYNFSDHLPVICDFDIKTTTTIKEYRPSFFVNVENPIKNTLNMQIYVENDQVLDFDIFAINGQKIEHFSAYISAGSNNLRRTFTMVPSLYFLKITNEQNESIVKKIVK